MVADCFSCQRGQCETRANSSFFHLQTASAPYQAAFYVRSEKKGCSGCEQLGQRLFISYVVVIFSLCEKSKTAQYYYVSHSCHGYIRCPALIRRTDCFVSGTVPKKLFFILQCSYSQLPRKNKISFLLKIGIFLILNSFGYFLFTVPWIAGYFLLVCFYTKPCIAQQSEVRTAFGRGLPPPQRKNRLPASARQAVLTNYFCYIDRSCKVGDNPGVGRQHTGLRLITEYVLAQAGYCLLMASGYIVVHKKYQTDENSLISYSAPSEK
jgi:hypothetical protein